MRCVCVYSFNSGACSLGGVQQPVSVRSRAARMRVRRRRARPRYRRRLSAPLLDRFDLRLAVSPPHATTAGESSAEVRARVAAAVHAGARFAGTPWRRNAHVPAGALERLVPLRPDTHDAWRAETEARQLTGRGSARIRRVAPDALADLDDADVVAPTSLWASPPAGGRAVSLTHRELAAAALVCLPDMTPAVCGRCSTRAGRPSEHSRR